MAHLGDQQSSKVTFNLEPNETFISFVDKFPDSFDASIGVLLFDQNDKLIYRLYKYSNPFQWKNFSEMTNWTTEDEYFESNEEIKT